MVNYMKYIKTLTVLFFMLLLCGCSSSESFTPPDYRVIEKPDSKTAETVDGYRTPREDSEPIIYYANKNSKKFHRPECKSVAQMLDTSVRFEENREALINDGYTPCGNCKP